MILLPAASSSSTKELSTSQACDHLPHAFHIPSNELLPSPLHPFSCPLCLYNCRKIADDRLCYFRLIHGVNMYMVQPICYQVNYLIRGIYDPCLLHRIGSSRSGPGSRGISQAGRYGQIADALHLLCTGNRHDAWKHRNRDPFSRIRYKKLYRILLSKNICVVRKSTPAVHLVLQIHNIVFLMSRLNMSFRIACRSMQKSLALNILYRRQRICNGLARNSPSAGISPQVPEYSQCPALLTARSPRAPHPWWTIRR